MCSPMWAIGAPIGLRVTSVGMLQTTSPVMGDRSCDEPEVGVAEVVDGGHRHRGEDRDKADQQLASRLPPQPGAREGREHGQDRKRRQQQPVGRSIVDATPENRPGNGQAVRPRRSHPRRAAPSALAVQRSQVQVSRPEPSGGEPSPRWTVPSPAPKGRRSRPRRLHRSRSRSRAGRRVIREHERNEETERKATREPADLLRGRNRDPRRRSVVMLDRVGTHPTPPWRLPKRPHGGRFAASGLLLIAPSAVPHTRRARQRKPSGGEHRLGVLRDPAQRRTVTLV